MFGTIAAGISAASNFLGDKKDGLLDFMSDHAGPFISAGGSMASAAAGTPLSLFGSKKMMAYARKQNQKYNEWLIPFQNAETLKYQDTYLRKSPSATVAGLRAAGLNPILAANGGFHTGTPSGASGGSSGSGGGSSSPNTRVDLMALENMQKQNDLLDSQIEGQKIKNKNNRMNRGLSGRYGAYSRILSEAADAAQGMSSRPKDYDSVMDSISKFLGTYVGNGPSNVKSKSPVSDAYRIDGSSFDTPPHMTEWSEHVNTDGFDSRLWSRSSKKYDGKYRYEKRQPWKNIFTR